MKISCKSCENTYKKVKQIAICRGETMSNYVANKIICKKKFYEKFFLDLNAFGDVELDDYIKTTPYITFNKLYNVKSINEYRDKYGTYIYYGFGHSVKELNNDLVEIKFQTSKYYPICAIKKAIELDNSIVWYAVEENLIYISKFAPPPLSQDDITESKNIGTENIEKM